jgi:hypothetical protein
MKNDDPEPKPFDPLEILEALRDTTDPRRVSLDRNISPAKLRS